MSEKAPEKKQPRALTKRECELLRELLNSASVPMAIARELVALDAALVEHIEAG